MGYGGLQTIRKGSTGPSVAYCQNLLNARGVPHPVLWVDGMFGPKTDQAVRHFQMMKHLEVDGVVGPMTWGALEGGPPPIQKRPAAQIQVPATAGF
jgi:peptidoglycan hydrolase-like protein with peptidoglycan-binding domain